MWRRGLELHFLGGANLLLFGQKLYIRLLGAVWELCGSCAIYKSGDVWVPCQCRVNEVSYPCRAMYGCRVGALWSLEGCKGVDVSQSEKNG